MKIKKYLVISLSSVALLALILDSQTAAKGMLEGIEVCLKVVIPSLFPMMLLTSVLTETLLGNGIQIPKSIRKALHLEKGDELLLITGLLGGYPIGAGNIADAYKQGAVKKEHAQRLLRFCNNAGPAFIFGMGGVLFHSPIYALITWMIQICSALLVAVTTPFSNSEVESIGNTGYKKGSNALLGCIKKMALVCGWVTLFRVLISFLQQWFLWLLPPLLSTAVTGVLELTNGICALAAVASEPIRFVLFNILLSFGGLCVHMQTGSVCGDLGVKDHFGGKILQTAFTAILSVLIQFFAFSTPMDPVLWIPCILIAICVIIFLKSYSILRPSHI